MVARALRLRAQVADALGQPDAAIALARSSVDVFDTIGAREQSLRSRRLLAWAHWRAGRIAESYQLNQTNLMEARALSDIELQIPLLCHVSTPLWMGGHLDEAEIYLHEALALASHLGDTRSHIYIEYELGNLWTERAFVHRQQSTRGAVHDQLQARAHFERALELAQDTYPYDTVFNSIDYAVALVQRGERAAARQVFDGIDRLPVSIDLHIPMKGWVLTSLAELALADGAADVARDRALEAVPLLEQGSPVGLAQAYRVAGQALSILGQAVAHWQASLKAARLYQQAVEHQRTRRAIMEAR